MRGVRWTPEIGTRFSRLVVIDTSLRVDPGRVGLSGDRRFLCFCDCGEQVLVAPASLASGNTRSCGCLKREAMSANGGGHLIHGLSYHPAYKAWVGMMGRCHNPSNRSYENYGGRGIEVWEPWRGSRVKFIAWVDANLGPRPEGYSLDRINNNGNYEPGNLRWTDWITQSNNRRPASRTRWSKREALL